MILFFALNCKGNRSEYRATNDRLYDMLAGSFAYVGAGIARPLIFYCFSLDFGI